MPIVREEAIPKTTIEEFRSMASPMAMDFKALFTLMRDDVLSLVRKAQKEGWNIDELITNIEELLK